MRLKDKVAIITGAGAGIGEAIAVRFAEEGARLVLNDITEKAAQRAVDLIRKMGVEAVSAVGDISNETDAARLTQVALDSYGRLNILVNNAANFTQKSVEDATAADWENVLKVNVIGTALVAKYAARAMVAAGAGGSIVNIGSMSGIVAQHNFATYNSSKGAVLTMTRCMALDLAPHHIRVNTVCPGCILTSASHREIERLGLRFEEWRDRVAPGHMLNRLGEPREVANAVLFLASDEASFITAEELLVDGGFIHW
jgi:NAD(P)-dependent dehydrogenase (short-subunit alcohol dehydrogenase family)